MLNLVKVISSSLTDRIRKIKFLRYGKSDIQDMREAMPYGVDSNPIKDMIAVYAPTGEIGKSVIIGYLNKNQVADVGEFRTFSTDADGAEQFYTHMKNDGTMEIGGDSDFMVRYSALETAFNQLKSDFNSHIHTTTATIGASATPGVITPPTVSSAADITPAKIDEIKTI